MTKANYIQWIEQQIVKLQEFGGMESEIWAFIQCLKKARQLGEHLNTPSAVGQIEQSVCDECDLADLGGEMYQCRKCQKIKDGLAN